MRSQFSRGRFGLRRFLARCAVVVVWGICAQQPCIAQRIAFVSNAPAERDAGDLHLLETKLVQGGFAKKGIQIKHLQVSLVPAVQERQVRELLSSTRWSLVIAATLNVARTVQVVDRQTPIVFTGAADPVRNCLAVSLTRPGKNATGRTTHIAAEAKMFEALNDAYPGLRRWVMLVDGREPDRVECDLNNERLRPADKSASCVAGPVSDVKELMAEFDILAIEGVAARAGKRVTYFRVCKGADFEAFALHLGAGQAQGVVVPLQFLFYQHASAVVDVLNSARLPAVYARPLFVQRGGLMSVSPKEESPRLATAFDIAVQVLLGADPATLPIQTPSGFDYWVNVGAARGLSVPMSLRALARADRLLD